MKTGLRNLSSSLGRLRRAANGEADRFLQMLARSLNLMVFLSMTWTIPALAAGSDALRIVVLGDSLVAGYNLKQDAGFPEVLQRRLRASGRNVAITNAGVSGNTAEDGLARMDWSIPDDTDLVIVELGANDMLRGIDPGKTRVTLDAIFRRVKERGMGLVIAGMRSIDNYGLDYRQKFDAIYPALAKQYDAPLFPFFMDGIFGHPELLLPDRLHPSKAGVEAMVEKFLPFIEPIVDNFPRVSRKAG